MSAARGPILLAAGGTGGHMMPAEALDQELRRRGHATRVMTDSRGGAVPGLFEATPVYRLRAGGMTGGPLRKAKAGLRLAANTLRARRLLKRSGARLAVGFGGYPAVSAVLAAQSLRLPTLLHEQNAVLGRANRLLARRASAIAVSFESTWRLPAGQTGRIHLTGNPVRAPLARMSDQPYPEPDPEARLRVLVIGGSLGARILSDVVPAAMARLPERLRGGLEVMQQCREEDLERVRAAYAEAGIPADLASFWRDLPERLDRAHLVIARAGASTVAELTAAGRPAILVPLAIATDDHQSANAAALEAAGGGWRIAQSDFTPARLAEHLEGLLAQPERLAAAGEAAGTLGRPNAAKALADLVEALLGVGETGERPATARAPAPGPSAIDQRERVA